MAISLELSMGHLVYQLKALIFLYLMIYNIDAQFDWIERKGKLKPFSDFYFVIQDVSLNIILKKIILDRHVENIHMEGTVSQMFY